MYHIDRTVKEWKHAAFGDGSHIVYVNGAYKDESNPVGKLMHDLFDLTATEAEAYLQKSKEGV